MSARIYILILRFYNSLKFLWLPLEAQNLWVWDINVPIDRFLQAF